MKTCGQMRARPTHPHQPRERWEECVRVGVIAGYLQEESDWMHKELARVMWFYLQKRSTLVLKSKQKQRGKRAVSLLPWHTCCLLLGSSWKQESSFIPRCCTAVQIFMTHLWSVSPHTCLYNVQHMFPTEMDASPQHWKKSVVKK